MMAGGLFEEAHAGNHSAAFFIQCAEIEPPDPGIRYCGGTHGAGFKRHIQIAAGEPLGSEGLAGRTYGKHFGVGTGVLQFPRPVARSRHNAAVADDNRADRNLAAPRSTSRFVQRNLHVTWLIVASHRQLPPRPRRLELIGTRPKGKHQMSDDNKGRTRKGASGDRPLRSRGFKSHGGNVKAGSRPGGTKSRGSRGFKDAPASTVTVRGRSEGGVAHDKRADPKPVTATDETTVPARPEERIAKRLARAGIASRREAETLITAGRVAVNGKVLSSPAVNVSAEDRIEIDGRPIPQTERTRLWLYHKPAGLVTSNRDPDGRPTVFGRLPPDLPRVVSVGRLDINTEGLLLLTNDGGLARVLELPQTGWLRRYRVRAHGRITQKRLDGLKAGMAVDGIFYGAIEATLEREQGANVWIEIGLREGKNREVKNVLGALGLEVNRLIRISYGPFQLGSLEPGAVLEVRGRTLRDQLGARLIAEAGADFDGPVLKSFPNRPVRALENDLPVSVDKSGDWVSGTRQDGSGKARGGPKKGFEKSGDRRERVRDQWSTKDPREEDGEPEKKRRREGRGSNVWMAPGARPAGGKRKGAAKGARPAKRRGAKKPDRG